MKGITSYLCDLSAGAQACLRAGFGLNRLALFAILLCCGQTAEAASRIALSPTAGVPTGKVTVKGTGFSAYEAVDVYFDTEDLCLGVTNASGFFSCALTVPKEALSSATDPSTGATTHTRMSYLRLTSPA